jgi:hypothetical protein
VGKRLVQGNESHVPALHVRLGGYFFRAGFSESSMTDVRKLMGWLNPKSLQYDGARGGTPELTAIDIAGALGMLRDDTAREIFCAIWWQDGARLGADVLDAKLRRLLLDEYSRRSLEASIAKLECHVVEGELEMRRLPSENDKRELSAARAKRSKADAQRWPWNVELYARMPSAVLNELRSCNLCPDCGGIGLEIRTEGNALLVNCQKCEGSGHEAASKVKRAAVLKISESAYRLVWEATYDWLFVRVSEMENDARRQLKISLGMLNEDQAA